MLAELVHEVIIGESRRKDDRLDPGTLARLARTDPQLAPVKHRSAKTQANLTAIAPENAVMQTRETLIKSSHFHRESIGKVASV